MRVSVDGRRSGISAVESAMSVSGRFLAKRTTGLPRQGQERKGACLQRCRLARQPAGWRLGARNPRHPGLGFLGEHPFAPIGPPSRRAVPSTSQPRARARGCSGPPTQARIKLGKEFTGNGRGGDRTRTELSLHGILSPVRLPVSPLGRRPDRIPVILPAAKRGLQSALFHTSPSFPALSSGTHK
jgi:hypothetical protein